MLGVTFPRIVKVFERFRVATGKGSGNDNVDTKRSLCKHISVDSTIQHSAWIRGLVSQETVVLRRWGVEMNAWFYQ